MRLFHFVAAVAMLSVIEAVLVVLGVLPPVLSYSPGNIMFSLAKLVVIVYAGVITASEGLKKSALNGTILGFAGAAALCIFSLLCSALLGKSVLGLPLTNIVLLTVVLAVIVVSNTVIGALLAAIAGFVAVRIRK
jgi:hypothetical protein